MGAGLSTSGPVRHRGMPSSVMHYYYNGASRSAGPRAVLVFSLEGSTNRASSTRRPSAHPVGDQAVDGRVARPLGRRHARRRDDHYKRPSDINLGWPARRRQSLPMSDQMRETERITRLARLVLLRDQDRGRRFSHAARSLCYPIAATTRGYLCGIQKLPQDHQIVPNLHKTSRYERAHPTDEPPQPPVTVGALLRRTRGAGVVLRAS